MTASLSVTLDGDAPRRRFLAAAPAVDGKPVMRVAAAGELPVGVTGPADIATGGRLRFDIEGEPVWWVEAGAAITPGQLVGAGADGRAVPVAEGDPVAVALALDAGDAPVAGPPAVPGTVIRVAPLRGVGTGGGGGEGGSVAWADITGKPSTFAPTIGATASTAVAGNDARLTAGAAGTATVRALGTTSTTAAAGDHTHTGLTADAAAGTASLRTLGTTATSAAAGNHTHTGLTADQAAATASIRTLGTGATQAAAGNHTHTGLLTGSASAVNNSTATDAAGLVADFNALLAALRTRGVITGS